MTAWSRAGSSYVCECRPGYEAVVELSGACAYAAPWGTVERAEGAVLTVVEQATGLAVAKRLRIAGATSPGDVDDVARRVSDARIGEEADPRAGKGAWAEDGLPLLRDLGFATAAMALSDDSVPLDDADLAAEPKLALVFGTEGDGLAPTTIAACDYTVRIPMQHGVDSLNVAAASAVAFWELRR